MHLQPELADNETVADLFREAFRSGEGAHNASMPFRKQVLKLQQDNGSYLALFKIMQVGSNNEMLCILNFELLLLYAHSFGIHACTESICIVRPPPPPN